MHTMLSVLLQLLSELKLLASAPLKFRPSTILHLHLLLSSFNTRKHFVQTIY
jgi:hypothetical protein